MDRETKYFYISGFISFSLFIILALLFVRLLFNPLKIDSYGLKKENYISVSIEIPKIATKKSKAKTKSKPLPSATTEEKSKNIDVNNLFSDVWTKKITKKREEPKVENNKRILEIQKQLKTTQTNDVTSISKKVDQLNSKQDTNEQSSTSTANQVNEYLAKIQAIVYEHFNVPQNSAGYSVKSVIELNALGKVLDFRILEYSANEHLNSEVDKIKDRLKNVIFPINPENRSSRTVVILIAKE